jgi:hypothetical protein
LAEPVAEAWERVEDAAVKDTDGTSWLQAGVVMCLWTVATATATVFKVLANGSKNALLPLFRKLTGILVSDRATALNFWAMERRQICWAHLLRKFVCFSERGAPAATLGQQATAMKPGRNSVRAPAAPTRPRRDGLAATRRPPSRRSIGRRRRDPIGRPACDPIRCRMQIS